MPSMDIHRHERVVGEGREKQSDECNEQVGLTRLRHAPTVTEEFPSRARADPALHATENVRRVAGELVGRERSFHELAHGFALALLVRFAFIAHVIFSPRAPSTSSFSCARARWMRLLTVPSGRPVM